MSDTEKSWREVERERELEEERREYERTGMTARQREEMRQYIQDSAWGCNVKAPDWLR